MGAGLSYVLGMFLLLLACVLGASPTDCPDDASCRTVVVIHVIGREGPVQSSGSFRPEDSGATEYDCASGSGPGWTCAGDGTLTIETSASALSLTAYGTDATSISTEVTPSWTAGGTAGCPSACEVGEATVTLDPYDTGCFAASDTGGCG